MTPEDKCNTCIKTIASALNKHISESNTYYAFGTLRKDVNMPCTLGKKKSAI